MGDAESGFLGLRFQNGWYVVVSSNEDLTALPSAPSDEWVACSVEEHVMMSIARGRSRSSEQWSITHDSQQGISHLETTGELPDCFESLRDSLFAEQAQGDQENPEVDYIFDIPLQVAKTLTGYHHDETDFEADEDGDHLYCEEVLVRISAEGGRDKPSPLDNLPGKKGCLLFLFALPSTAVLIGLTCRAAIHMIRT